MSSAGNPTLSSDWHAWADALHLARTGGPTVQPAPNLTLPQAYAVAAQLHARRLASGDTPVGRKIGHTNPALWRDLGLTAPSWAWLYASSTWHRAALPSAAGWREPKVELELALHLGLTPPRDADPATLAGCVASVALGLEFVDRPYPAWGGSVADSVAAGGVHVGLWVGEPQALSPGNAPAWDAMSAELQVGDAHSAGGSALVLGSPLAALAALQNVLSAQGAPPLQAGEWITTGALAPALPYRPGAALRARIEAPGFNLSF